MATNQPNRIIGDGIVQTRQSGGHLTASVSIPQLIRRLPKGGGGELKFLKITAKAGASSPFVYSGVDVTHDGSNYYDGTHWTGTETIDKIINLSELYVTGCIPLPDNGMCICMYQMVDGTAYIDANPNKGTY